MIFVAAAGTAALVLQHSLAPEPFAAHLSRGLGRDISIDSVALSLTPLPRVRMEGVVLAGLGTAGAAEVDVRTRPLLRGKVVARSVRFEDLAVTLYRREDGGFEPIVAPRESGAPFDWRAFPRVEAQRGELRIVQGENVSAVIGLQSLSLARFHEGDDETLGAPLVLAGRVGGADHGWSVRPLQLRGRLVRHADRFSFEDGRVRAEEAYVGWWSGRDVRARFRYDHGRVEVDPLDVVSFDGRWQADGVVHLRGGTRLDFETRITDVSVARLFGTSRPDDALADLGRLRTAWQLRIPWDGGPRFERGHGDGHLTITGGTLPTTSLSAKLSDAFGMGLEQPRTTPVESLEAPVTLRDGRVRSEAATLVTGDYELRAAGSVGLDRSLELEGELHLAGWPAVPVTIGGALPHPELETHPSRIPGRSLGAVADAFRNTGRKIRGLLRGNEPAEAGE